MRYVRDIFRGWNAETNFGFYVSSFGVGFLGGFIIVLLIALLTA